MTRFTKPGAVRKRLPPSKWDAWTVDELRQVIEETLEPGMPAIWCVCTRRIHLDKRRLTSAMVRSLIRLHNWDVRHPGEFMDYRNWRARGEPRNHTLMRWGDGHLDREYHGGWALIEPKEKRGKTGKEAGWWRITERGRLFLKRKLRVPKAMFHFADHAWEFAEGTIGVDAALGEEFDLDQLLYDNDPE